MKSEDRKEIKWFSYTIFIIVLLLFAQALWLNLSYKVTSTTDTNFGIGFDEAQHLKASKYYADRTIPIHVNDNTNWDTIGGISRHPSFGFYILTGITIRFTQAVTHSFVASVVLVRLFNTLIFCAGLYAYWRLMLRMKLSSKVAYLALFLFTLIPGVSLLASRINYDNIIFVLTPALFIMTAKVLDKRNLKQDIFKYLWIILMIGLTGSIIKYTFLVIFLPVVLYVAQFYYRKRSAFNAGLRNSFHKTRWKNLD